jgi:hypothetical protein
MIGQLRARAAASCFRPAGSMLNQPQLPSAKKRFTQEEDRYLFYLVTVVGIQDWKTVACHMTGRSIRQCRERFKYYLEPGLSRPVWTEAEDRLLLDKHATIGPKWAQLALFFTGRTDIDLKNRYHHILRSASREPVLGDEEVPADRTTSPDQQQRPLFPPLASLDMITSPGQGAIVQPMRPRRVICTRIAPGPRD